MCVRPLCVVTGALSACFSSMWVSLCLYPQARQTAEQTHLKELGRPEDIAAAVAYLASDDARYVTGETLVVAGGMPSKL